MIRIESIVYIYILGYKKKKCKTFFNVNKNTKRDIKVMKNKFYKKKRHNK